MKIHLQGHGKQEAKFAESIKIGDVLMWNYGATSKVINIISETPKYITLGIQEESGNIYERRLKKDRLVAFVP